jgi:tellurium resistance protein TerZ
VSISMTKGQKISLSKADGGQLTRVRMGLGWDPIPTKGMFGRTKQKAVDLDASCVLLDANRKVVDAVWFKQLKSKDGSIAHTGDNLTGEGEGDDESIIVDLTSVPSAVNVLVFTVTSFSRQGFSEVSNASCRVVDETSGQEVARYDLSAQGPHTGMIIARVYRHQAEWKMAAMGDTGNGKTYQDLMPLITATI